MAPLTVEPPRFQPFSDSAESVSTSSELHVSLIAHEDQKLNLKPRGGF